MSHPKDGMWGHKIIYITCMEKLLELVKQTCEKHNVHLVISDHKRVEINGIKTNGFFCSESKVLAAARGGKSELEFRDLLAHEYCHLLQWTENPQIFETKLSSADIYPDELIDRWIEGENFHDKDISQAYAWAEKIERDCEQRTVELLQKLLGSNFNKKDYSKKANAYLNFYPYSKKFRAWYDKAPYEIEDIVDAMPDKIEDSSLMSPTLEKMYRKCLHKRD